jgi:hypothetical protein
MLFGLRSANIEFYFFLLLVFRLRLLFRFLIFDDFDRAITLDPSKDPSQFRWMRLKIRREVTGFIGI